MKRTITLLAALLLAPLAAMHAADWKPVPGHIMTEWAGKVNPNNPLPEYPQPQLVRDNWVNLNGLWDYAVTKKTDPQPAKFDGKILVPFCIESALSGVNRKFTPEDRLWYSRDFTAPALAQGEHLLLNFGAVDYEATVLVNGKELGTHRGGYDAFSWDITEALQPGANRLVVAVLDPTGGGPSGKQRLGGGDIWYTPSSGIWQTVWLEKVPENGLMTYDRKVVKANVDLFREALSKREFPPEPTVKALLPSLSSTPSSPTPFPGKGACLSQ